MTNSLHGLLTRTIMWVAAGIFALSLLFVGTVAAVLGGVWMLLTGRNPVQLVRNYAGLARRMPGGSFQWGMHRPATEAAGPAAATGAAPASGGTRFGRAKADVEDVVVKELR